MPERLACTDCGSTPMMLKSLFGDIRQAEVDGKCARDLYQRIRIEAPDQFRQLFAAPGIVLLSQRYVAAIAEPATVRYQILADDVAVGQRDRVDIESG